MKDPTAILNLDDPETKRRLISKIRAAKGLWECDLKPYRLTRSLQQNKYYWAGVVTPFLEWLREAYGDQRLTAEQAHEMLRDKILGEMFTRIKIGPLGQVPFSTTRLNTEEFSDYIERAAKWLAEFCEIIVIPADLFTIQKENLNERNTTRTRRIA